MGLQLTSVYRVLPEVIRAISHGLPVVALESAVITHGLPYPINIELAMGMEQIIREDGGMPATIALLDGKIAIGLSKDELTTLGSEPKTIKVSARDMGAGIVLARSGGTTVAATLVAARTAGIRVFATGGIGGVHRGLAYDISADLDEIARSKVVVVCAGAKAILNLPATLEALETRGVPVIGYQTDDFPAFFSSTSGLKVSNRVDSPEAVRELANAHWEAGNTTGVLVCNPIPHEAALDQEMIENVIERAVSQAEEEGISGAGLTPYLLDAVNRHTSGKSLAANLALLKNNARLASKIAHSFVKREGITY